MDNSVKESMAFSEAQCLQHSKMIQDTIRQSACLDVNAASQMSSITNRDYEFSCSIVFVQSVVSLDNSSYYTWILDS